MLAEAICESDSGCVSILSFIGLTEKKFLIKDRLVIYTRSSHPEVFCEKGVLKNFTKFTEKHLCQSLFFNNIAGLRLNKVLPVIFFLKKHHPRCLNWALNASLKFSLKTILVNVCLSTVDLLLLLNILF